MNARMINPGSAKQKNMTVCDHCANECTLPFTCQRCGGKFCADCRLPPNHNCTGLGSWNKKPRPAVGTRSTRGGVNATGGIAAESRRGAGKTAAGTIPYLKIMAVITFLIILGLAWLVLGGY